MKKLLLILFCLPLIGVGQTRYLDDIFTNVTVTSDVQYAENISVLPMLFGGQPALTPILCDIYQPTGDNLTERPVVILAHTGSFLPQVINGQPTGDKTDSSIVQQCMRWARKGYVAVAMNYRLGWNPTSPDQDTRTSTLLQAAYRGIQDAKAMVRFLRKTEDLDGNPYGIDPNKFALGGQGSGGYISLGYATLDTVGDINPWQEIYLPKFFNLTTMFPYIYPYWYGNYDGTDSTWLPAAFSSTGNDELWNVPNWPNYSNDINMAFNIGGCLADSSWLEYGDVPMVSFHCTNDPYGPYANGDVIVPTTGNFVVEVQGSYIVQKHQAMYGNNAVFSDVYVLGIGEDFTNAANANNDGYEGLYPFLTPPPSSAPNAFGESYEEEGAPWDWWDANMYEQIANAIHDPNGNIPAGNFAANSILGNPNMSSAHGNAYLDTIQGYLNPRMFFALGLGPITGCTSPSACNYDSTAMIDDGTCTSYCGCDSVSVWYEDMGCTGSGGYNFWVYSSGWYINMCNLSPGGFYYDSIYVSINNSNTGTSSVTACDSYSWDGVPYTTSGAYTNTYTNAAGCDSVHTLNLTIYYSNGGATWITSCDGWLWTNGTAYFVSGTYTYVITLANGCTYTDTLNLTINYSNTGTSSVTACDSYSWDGVAYTTSGAYTNTYTNAAGCDSVHTLNLTINYSNTGTSSVAACDSYSWDGVIYTASGTYTNTYTNAAGCDSAAILNLTINNSTINTTVTTVCDSYTWSVNGATYSTSGTYTDVSTNANGCDHTETLNLTINNSTSNSTTTTACDSYTWSVNGTTYSASGTYTDLSTNASGCTHTETLNLTINNSTSIIDTRSECDSYSTYWYDSYIDQWYIRNFSESGTYSYTIEYLVPSGATPICDTIFILNLTINNSSLSSSLVTACDSYTWNGTDYTSTGAYTWNGTNAAGCDSLVTLHLTIHNSSTSSVDTTSCDSYTWNGQAYTTSGTYIWTGVNAVVCDSIVTLNFTSGDVTPVITQVEDSLYSTVNPSGTDYTAQWLNIDEETGKTWLMGEDKNFGPRFDCNYILVTTTAEGCIDTTGVYFFAEFAGQIYDLKISPNPTRGLINIKYVNERNQFVRIYFANSNGVVLDEFISSGNEMNVDISKYPSGIYYVYFSSEEHCSSAEQQISRKIILNK